VSFTPSRAISESRRIVCRRRENSICVTQHQPKKNKNRIKKVLNNLLHKSGKSTYWVLCIVFLVLIVFVLFISF
jgi:hypothetical protein